MLNPRVESVASVFISRWDAAVLDKAPDELRDKLGIVIAEWTYKAYCDQINSDRWRRLANYGAHAQHVLWASTRTKDPQASDYLYIRVLASSFPVNTMPEQTLLKFGEQGTPIGGLKVVAESGWFAVRPSGTENIYKIYAESFRGVDHLRRILEEAQTIVDDALAAFPQQPGIPSEPNLKEKP